MPQPRVTSSHTYTFNIYGEADTDTIIAHLRTAGSAVGTPNKVAIKSTSDQRDGTTTTITVSPNPTGQ